MDIRTCAGSYHIENINIEHSMVTPINQVVCERLRLDVSMGHKMCCCLNMTYRSIEIVLLDSDCNVLGKFSFLVVHQG